MSVAEAEEYLKDPVSFTRPAYKATAIISEKGTLAPDAIRETPE